MKTKITLLLLTVLLLIPILTACGHIEDTNGPSDPTVVTITDDKILSGVNSYTQVMAVKTEVGRRATYKADKFSGVTTVISIPYAVGTEMPIRTSILCEEGNLRVVLIHEDEILCDLPLGEGQVTVISEPRRDYKIKIAGESTKFSLELEYEVKE